MKWMIIANINEVDECFLYLAQLKMQSNSASEMEPAQTKYFFPVIILLPITVKYL